MTEGVLVFDMDGVLVDVSESYRETIRETVTHFTGKTISRDLIQDYKNAGGWNNDWALSQKIISDLGREVEYSLVVEQFQKIFFGDENRRGLMLNERWLPTDGLLERLAARFHLGIFTGRLRMEAALTLDRFLPDLRWDVIMADDDVQNSKPAPDGLLNIAQRFPTLKIVYVGDTIDDANAARGAGVPFIGIAGQHSPRRDELVELLKGAGAISVIENINQLETAL